jgi:pimeloyl-ACP methyl ester carboxylesterase
MMASTSNSGAGGAQLRHSKQQAHHHSSSTCQKMSDPLLSTSSTSSQEVNVEEITLTCKDGTQLAAQRWRTKTCEFQRDDAPTTTTTTKILCLHGYLDNCRSFHILAPRLVSAYQQHGGGGGGGGGVDLVAMDFPGHGRSSHKSPDHPPMMVISDFVFYVSEAVRLLEWQQFSSSSSFVLIGHSMGSIIAIQYAAAFPQQIQTLVLLDGYGPEAEAEPGSSNVTERLRQHITLRYKINNNNNNNTAPLLTTKKIYPTIAAATATRMKTARNCPGNQWLSETAARELVQRALMMVPQNTTNNTTTTTNNKKQQYVFRHDPRLVAVGPMLLHTPLQVDEYWKGLTAQCRQIIWLRAEYGWPFDPLLIRRAEELLLASSSSSSSSSKKKNTVEVLPGSHHFHADPETADDVAIAILKHIRLLPDATRTRTTIM